MLEKKARKLAMSSKLSSKRKFSKKHLDENSPVLVRNITVNNSTGKTQSDKKSLLSIRRLERNRKRAVQDMVEEKKQKNQTIANETEIDNSTSLSPPPLTTTTTTVVGAEIEPDSVNENADCKFYGFTCYLFSLCSLYIK